MVSVIYPLSGKLESSTLDNGWSSFTDQKQKYNKTISGVLRPTFRGRLIFKQINRTTLTKQVVNRLFIFNEHVMFNDVYRSLKTL